jgi:2-polyprenyl-6-methoxyphenol hydroxylase-like FAD-dependent oxidoreductase
VAFDELPLGAFVGGADEPAVAVADRFEGGIGELGDGPGLRLAGEFGADAPQGDGGGVLGEPVGGGRIGEVQDAEGEQPVGGGVGGATEPAVGGVDGVEGGVEVFDGVSDAVPADEVVVQWADAGDGPVGAGGHGQHGVGGDVVGEGVGQDRSAPNAMRRSASVGPSNELNDAAVRARKVASMSEHRTCVIIGGGPAGMVLGLLLARAGVEASVLEKHGDFLRDFRGDTVHPSTLQLLDELGLGERFSKLPVSRIDEIAFPIDAHHRVVIDNLRQLKTLKVRYPYIAMVPQRDLLDLLADSAKEEPSFTLRMRTEVTELIHESGRVHGVRYRTQDGTSGEIRADLTIGCDGRWSIARKQARLRPKEFPVPIDAWWYRLPRKPHDNLAALMPYAAEGRFVLVVPRDDFLQLGYFGRKGTDAQLRAQGIEHFQENIAQAVPWLTDRVDALTSMDDVKYLDVRTDRLNRLPRLCTVAPHHAYRVRERDEAQSGSISRASLRLPTSAHQRSGVPWVPARDWQSRRGRRRRGGRALYRQVVTRPAGTPSVGVRPVREG